MALLEKVSGLPAVVRYLRVRAAKNGDRRLLGDKTQGDGNSKPPQPPYDRPPGAICSMGGKYLGFEASSTEALIGAHWEASSIWRQSPECAHEHMGGFPNGWVVVSRTVARMAVAV